MEWRLKKYEWFWWAKKGGVRFRLENTPNGIYINAADGRLRITAKDRWSLYRRGIRARLSSLAQQYHIPDFVRLKPGDLVIDIGANIGEFSLWAAEAGARVAAFEPDPLTLECLRENTAESERIEIHPIGLWDDDGQLLLHVDPEDANSSFVNESGSDIRMDVARLDTLMAARGFPSVKLIKLDAEGGEPEVLRGGEKTLKHTEYITIDCGYERNNERTLEACEEFLSKLGFEILLSEKTGRCNLVARNT